MKEKEAYVYIDDVKEAIEAFENAARENWNLNIDVISNDILGRITRENYDSFKKQIFSDIEENLERIQCVFLDLDFSGEEKGGIDNTGFIIGKEIRHKWPQIPIILTTRFTENEISQKGMVFDFDNLIKPGELIRSRVETFHGIVDIAQKKRQNILKSIGDIPISYQLGVHKYFKPSQGSENSYKYAFIAMPFNTKIVSSDIYNLVIKEVFIGTDIIPIRVDSEKNTFSIIDKIAFLIYNCDIMIADITGENPNVMYELGIAHSANKKCITLVQKNMDLKIPFDIRHLRLIPYDGDNLTKLVSELRDAIEMQLE